MARTFPVQDTPPVPLARQRWTWMWIAFAAIVVLLTILGFWWAGKPRSAGEDVRGDASQGSPAAAALADRITAGRQA